MVKIKSNIKTSFFLLFPPKTLPPRLPPRTKWGLVFLQAHWSSPVRHPKRGLKYQEPEPEPARIAPACGCSRGTYRRNRARPPMTPNRDSSSRLVEQPLVIFSLLRQRKSFSVEELVRFQRAFFGSPARSGNAATQQNTQQARSPPRTSGVPAPVKDAGRRRSRRGAPVGTTPTSGAEETFT